MDQIVSELHSNNIILISGPTGSGKSTGVPKLLIENFKDSKILVAQPRRLGAESLCNRMRQLLQPKLVGLRMGFGVKDEYPETRLWYMTVGYIVRLLINNINYLSPGDILIFDEIHESGLDQDLLCFLAKNTRAKNGSCDNCRNYMIGVRLFRVFEYFLPYRRVTKLDCKII